MKTAVSVPDDLFDRVDRLAKRTRRSRSEVYSAALRDYVNRHEVDAVTETLERVLRDPALAAPDTGFVRESARRILRSSDW